MTCSTSGVSGDRCVVLTFDMASVCSAVFILIIISFVLILPINCVCDLNIKSFKIVNFLWPHLLCLIVLDHSNCSFALFDV